MRKLVFCSLLIIVLLLYPAFEDASVSAETNVRTLLTTLPNRTLDQNKYSIIISTYKNRQHNLNIILSDYLCNTSKYLNKIYIYWNDFKINNPPMSELDLNIACPYKVPLHIYDTVYRNVSSRYLIPDSLDSQYIFTLDDDLVIELYKVDRMFEVFKENNLTNRIFGPYARRYYSYKYLTGYKNPYNFVLTGLSFMNAKYYEIFQSPKYKNFRDYCSKTRNNDDIMFNFVVMNTTGLPQVACKVKWRELPQNKESISGQKGFASNRMKFIKYIFKQTGLNDTHLLTNTQVFNINT